MRATPFDKYWVQLEFASNEERIKLEKAVSYTVPGSSFNPAFNAGFWNGTKSFLTEGNKLPAGIFKSIFPDHKLVRDYDHTDLNYVDVPLYRDNPQYERRDYQLEAINTILHHKRMIVAAVVGSGKTLIAAATISYLLEKDSKNKVLFVCYDKNILAQSIKNFKKYGLNVTQYGDGVKDLTGDVVVATVQSLTRIEKPRKVLAPFTACFCDESHHSKSKTSKAVLTRLVNCDYYIGLTGTPFKDKTLELAELMAVLGPVMFQYGFERAVGDKNIAPVKCIFLKLPYDEEVKGQVIDRKNYKHIWDKAIKESKTRNRSMSKILKYTTELLSAPAIVMVDRVEHGNIIGDEIRKIPGVACLEMYGEDSVIVRDMKKASLMTDEINLLISSVLNEGVDLAISPVIAVNASGRKNFINMIQFLGRIVRSNTKFGDFRVYIDFIDTAHPILKKHSLERIQNCKDTGSEVVLCDTLQDVVIEIIKHYKAIKP
jgi:superfamily II DNA or RNA helicase